MSDLIDRQLVLDRINKQREHLRPYLYPQDKIGDSAYRICAEFVERLPSAELEIIGCKDCKHADYSGCKNGNFYCLEHGIYINESDFCSRGVKDCDIADKSEDMLNNLLSAQPERKKREVDKRWTSYSM